MSSRRTKATDDVRWIRAMRLRNQGLAPGRRSWPGPADVARGMVAMQAQDFGAVHHALALRCSADDSGRPGPTEAAVARSFADGTVVRNRPSRGTL